MDDVFGEEVAGCGLGTEDEDAGMEVGSGIVEDLTIEGDDVQQVEVLALVFVEALDLDVKDGVRADMDAAGVLDDFGEDDFVAALDVVVALTEGAVVSEGIEAA